MAETDRPSAPLLKLMREWIQKKGLNTAAAALAMGVDRARARRVLSGAEAMTVDELLALGGLLELKPEDLALPAFAEVDESSPLPDGPRALSVAPEPEGVALDPYGNHPEQLFRAAFALGCDFMFIVNTEDLADSGVPASVLGQHAGRELPIKLDAAYHNYNDPSYSEAGVTLTLSFDALYTCTFPWSSFRQFIFFPVVPDPIAETRAQSKDSGRPKLRLVT